jgi:hypothetical protein
MSSLARWCLFVPLSLCAFGCRSALGDAMAAYADGQYPTAAAQFRAAEPAARRLNRQGFANYALYRGLSHLALGDAQAATRWVGYAKRCADRDPLLFSDRDRGALLSAWRSMGHLAGE